MGWNYIVVDIEWYSTRALREVDPELTSAKYMLRELWDGTKAEMADGSIRAKVAAHGTVMSSMRLFAPIFICAIMYALS